MATLSEKLNFTVSSNGTPDRSIKLYAKNRDYGYYYDNLCLYCANNDIELSNISDTDFSSAADIMSGFGSADSECVTYYFWIDA